MRSIPIFTAGNPARIYGYDQVVVIARKVGEDGYVTTYGVDGPNCTVAARVGDYLKHVIIGWPKED